jgi:TonB family protein
MMKHYRLAALVVSLLLHAAGGVLLLRSGRTIPHHESTPSRAEIRLVDPETLPRNEDKTLTARPSAPVPVREPDKVQPETGDPIADESVAEPPGSADGIKEDLPGGGDYPGPAYPERARREGREGTVVVLIQVDDSGKTAGVSLDSVEGGSDFARSVLRSIGSWHFPAGFAGTYRRRFLFRLEG